MVKNPPVCRRPEFDPWGGKISWRRKQLPPPVFLPGKSHEQRRLADYSPQGCKESDTAEHSCMHDQVLKTWMIILQCLTGGLD